jgi:hypothetical protein
MADLVALARMASERPPVAAGLFQVLALKRLSVYHLTIRPFKSGGNACSQAISNGSNNRHWKK